MKALFKIIALAASVQMASAGFTVPSDVYSMDQLTDAKAEAQEKGEALMFIYSDSDGNWAPCDVASLAAIKEFQNAGVVVFVDDFKERMKLPSGANALLHQGGSTTMIPLVLVTTADGEKGIGVVPYESLKKSARRAAKKMEKLSKDKISELAAEKAKADSVVKIIAEEQVWTNSEGKAIRAAVVSVGSANVEFLMKKKKVSYPLNKLSEQSAAKLRELVK